MNELESREGMDKLILEQQKLKYKVLKPSCKLADRCNELNKENAKLKEEYEAECHRSDELEDSFWKEVEKNKQLKYLLKECRPYINHSAASRMMKNSAGYKKDMKLLTKIDEALK